MCLSNVGRLSHYRGSLESALRSAQRERSARQRRESHSATRTKPQERAKNFVLGFVWAISEETRKRGRIVFLHDTDLHRVIPEVALRCGLSTHSRLFKKGSSKKCPA